VLTTTEVFDDAALTALIAGATLLGSDLHAGLYVNAIAPSKVLTIADLVEPTYGGYARQAVVMGAVFRDPVNGISALSAALLWQETGAASAVTIQGIFYVTGAGPSLLGIEPFPSPIPLVDLLSAFSTILQYIQSSPNPGFTTILQ
jgi:hypothetical protein